MAEIGRWNGHIFEVSPSIIRTFTDLTIKGASETKDKTSSKQKYVARKNGKPLEVTLTVSLSAALGCDVFTEAKNFISEARAGKKDYFYINSKKMLLCQLMLTDASITNVKFSGTGLWISADVKLTMKQASKNDPSSNSSSSKKKSTKKKSVKTYSTKKSSSSKKTTTAKTGTSSKSSGSSISNSLKKAVSAAASAIKKATSTAKKVSAAKKTSTAKKTVPTVVQKNRR